MMRAILLFAVLLLGACASADKPRLATPQLGDLETAMSAHVAVLTSKTHGNRHPGTAGEKATLGYLQREWQAIGLESGTNDPANPWLAPVELMVTRPVASSAVLMNTDDKRALLDDETGKDISVYTLSRRGLLDSAPLLFVGRQGSDLGRTALAGRVAVMVWDRPDAAAQYRALIENGAAAVLSIVPDAEKLAELRQLYERGRYILPYEVGSGVITGYMSEETAARLLGEERTARLMAGLDKQAYPEPLDIAATLEAVSKHEPVTTHNLIGRLPGHNPKAGAVMVTAHWDNLDHCDHEDGAEAACPGAVDNASGLAFITELARLLKHGGKIDRDIYFVATTGEEWGLLGARALGQSPPVPLDEIVAAFNVDSIAIAPRGSGVAIVGEGLTALDGAISEIVEGMGRELVRNELAREALRRQDSWALLQRDVPAVAVSSAFADPPSYEQYITQRYHSADDNAASIELGGAAEDLILHRALLSHFASAQAWPGRKNFRAAPAPANTALH